MRGEGRHGDDADGMCAERADGLRAKSGDAEIQGSLDLLVPFPDWPLRPAFPPL